MENESRQNPPRWKHLVGWSAAVVMALLWLVAGVWKLTDLSGFQVKMTQLLVPVSVSLPATFTLAVSETFTGLLLLRPAWRRWGGYLSVALLLVFMAYVGINYEALRGADCSCFPWIERAVGPGFFIGDGIMLAIGALAAVFSPPPARPRGAATLLAGVVVLGGVSAGWDQLGPGPESDVPATIQVESGELNLHDGAVFIYFFNPTCLHCLDAGIAMAELNWKATFVGAPTQDFEFAPGFVDDTGLQDVQLSPDLDLLRGKFPFEDVPYGVAVDEGRVVGRLLFFEEPELSKQLRAFGFVE